MQPVHESAHPHVVAAIASCRASSSSRRAPSPECDLLLTTPPLCSDASGLCRHDLVLRDDQVSWGCWQMRIIEGVCMWATERRHCSRLA